jgi:hypothetical protein
VRASKQAEVIALLRRPEGATVDEVRATTGWQPHSARRFFGRSEEKARACCRRGPGSAGPGLSYRRDQRMTPLDEKARRETGRAYQEWRYRGWRSD